MKSFFYLSLLINLLIGCSSQMTLIDTRQVIIADNFISQDSSVNSDTKNIFKQTNDLNNKKSILAENPLNDPNSIMSMRSVYFAYNKYQINSLYMPLIYEHANFLNHHPKIKIVIEGNTDERGSHEYNLALGQKRAVALKEILMLKGVANDQIETISYGEESPKVNGHAEIAWAENRRSDIVYQNVQE